MPPERCELVIFLVSPEWRASEWCVAEFLLAKNLNKRIVGVIVDPIPLEKLPVEMTAEWQLVDLTAGKRDHKVTVTPPPGDKSVTVAFAEDGLERLRIGLMQAGLDARYFAWPPEDDPEGPTIVGLDLLRGSERLPHPGYSLSLAHRVPVSRPSCGPGCSRELRARASIFCPCRLSGQSARCSAARRV